MGAQALPPPGQQQSDSGPGPGGGFPSPAPAQADQGAAKLLQLVQIIVSSSRMIAQQVPGTVPEVRQINDLVAQMQRKIVASQPATEAQAPPV